MAKGADPAGSAPFSYFMRRHRAHLVSLRSSRRMRRLASFVVVVIAGASHHLAAQTLPTSDPMLKRIWALGMDSSRTWDLSQTFFDSIGPRLTGTPQGNQASDWVIKTYKAWGIDAKREQYGTARGWR